MPLRRPARETPNYAQLTTKLGDLRGPDCFFSGFLVYFQTSFVRAFPPPSERSRAHVEKLARAHRVAAQRRTHCTPATGGGIEWNPSASAVGTRGAAAAGRGTGG